MLLRWAAFGVAHFAGVCVELNGESKKVFGGGQVWRLPGTILLRLEKAVIRAAEGQVHGKTVWIRRAGEQEDGVAWRASYAVESSLTREQLVEFYRLMYLSRRTDDREIVLKRQQKIFFQVSCAGHEALLVAAGMAMRPGYDWFFPYYRDRAICLALGNTVEEQLLQAVGAADDTASGGRQMPSHWSSRKLNIVTPSSSTATQCLHAVGCAEAGRYFSRHPEAAAKHDGDYREFKDVTFHGDEVVYVSIGEGSTSQGEFWESLNTASNGKLPVVYVVEDNGYAISTPVEANTPGGNISKLVANFPNFHFAEIDGTDPIASYKAMVEAVAYCRAGKGPALVHGHVIRPYSHSLSDDERLYRSAEELEADALRDPISRMQMWLLREGILDADGINRLEQQVDEEVQRAADRAVMATLPTVDSITKHVYSEDLTSDGCAVCDGAGGDRGSDGADDGGPDQLLPEGRDAAG